MGLPEAHIHSMVGATMFQVLLLMMDFFDWTLSQMVKWNMDTHKIEMLLSYHICPPHVILKDSGQLNNTLVPGPV
jgi:hypothetical protein